MWGYHCVIFSEMFLQACQGGVECCVETCFWIATVAIWEIIQYAPQFRVNTVKVPVKIIFID